VSFPNVAIIFITFSFVLLLPMIFFKTICFFNLLNGKVYSRNASFALNWISTNFFLHTCVYNYINSTKLLRRGYRNMTSFLRYGVLSKWKTYLLYMHDVSVIIRLDCRNVLLVWYLFFPHFISFVVVLNEFPVNSTCLLIIHKWQNSGRGKNRESTH
jgi:hypothetical protein